MKKISLFLIFYSLVFNSYCQSARDCNNVVGGSAKLDPCGVCTGGTTRRNPCTTLADGNYTIKALHSGQCVQAGTLISQQTCSAKNNQIWKIVKKGNFYQIQNAGNDQYLTYKQAIPVSMFDGKTFNGWLQNPSNSWITKNDLMASKGVAQGEITTTGIYSFYRIIFSIKHTVTNLDALLKDHSSTDHYASALIFGNTPPAPILGLQFGLPTGRHFDYRYKNYADNLFTVVNKTNFAYDKWSRVEILVDARNGTGRMAVAQPIGSKAVEVLYFKDITAGKPSPVAFQMHNAGLFDEYKDISIEIDPKVNDLITTKTPDNPVLDNQIITAPVLTDNLWRLEDAGNGNITLVASTHIGAVADVASSLNVPGTPIGLFTRTANNNQKFVFAPANITGVEDDLDYKDISYYPTQFNKEINLSSTGNFHYDIYDISGNIVEQKDANSSTQAGLNLIPGNYLIKIKNSKEERIVKVQKIAE